MKTVSEWCQWVLLGYPPAHHILSSGGLSFSPVKTQNSLHTLALNADQVQHWPGKHPGQGTNNTVKEHRDKLYLFNRIKNTQTTNSQQAENWAYSSVFSKCNQNRKLIFSYHIPFEFAQD